MNLVFWGTRGSLPMNSPDHRLFGGNTPCVSICAGETMIAFDGGSGLVNLGAEILAAGRTEIDICFSHFHADHICGLPFFKPLFNSEMTVRLHSFGPEAANLRNALGIYLQDPIFPMGLADFEADLQFKHHDPNETLSFNELNVTALPIPHPGGAHALKASNGPKNFVYATDTEHSPSDPNQNLIAFMRDADLAVYDCTYDDDEFATRRGWGHSTWQEGLRLADAAKVKKFGIFHHDPERSDEMLLEIEKRAKDMLANSFVTRDFMRMEI